MPILIQNQMPILILKQFKTRNYNYWNNFQYEIN